MKTVKTPKGTELPLVNLKGKDYLMVGHRLVWFNETETNFQIMTEFLKIENDYAIARAVINVFDKDGKPIKSASATKREDAKHFPDFIEKAETSAIGRAVAMLGYGTQFALADLDEGSRLADSPMVDVKASKISAEVKATPALGEVLTNTAPAVGSATLQNGPMAAAVTATTTKASSFRKPSKKTEAVAAAASDGWE